MNLAALLLVAALAPAPATDDSADPSARATVTVDRVVLVVDHRPLLEQQAEFQAEKMGRFVREDVTKALREQHGIGVVDEYDTAPVIVVKISWVDYARSIYRFELSVQRGGAAAAVDRWELESARSSDLTGSVVERLPAAIETLQRPAEAAGTDPPPGPTTPSASKPEAATRVDDAPKSDRGRPKQLGPVGITGIVIGASGLVVASVALGTALREPTVTLDSADEQGQIERGPWAGTYGWFATGLGLAGVGVTMLALDLTVLRERRRRDVTLTPTLGPTAAGLELSARF